jgi:ankyrin repeat protein
MIHIIYSQLTTPLNMMFLIISRVVEYLLRHDADVSIRDQQGYNAVHYAALNGQKLTIEMLLDVSSTDVLSRSGVGPSASALHLAVGS